MNQSNLVNNLASRPNNKGVHCKHLTDTKSIIDKKDVTWKVAFINPTRNNAYARTICKQRAGSSQHKKQLEREWANRAQRATTTRKRKSKNQVKDKDEDEQLKPGAPQDWRKRSTQQTLHSCIAGATRLYKARMKLKSQQLNNTKDHQEEESCFYHL